MEDHRNGQNEEIIQMGGLPSSIREAAVIVWPGPGKPKMGIITQWPMHQLLLHWDTDRTVLCVAPFMVKCGYCEAMLKRRWRGYIGAYDASAGRHILMEITPGAAAAVPQLLSRGPSLVNHRIRTFRQGNSPTARMGAELSPPIPGSKAPKPINYAACLWHLFGFKGNPGEGTITQGRS